MQNNGEKSSVVAGLLGIFLGSFGAHNWYLGQKNKGIMHVCLFGAGVLIAIISTILSTTMNWYTVYKLGWLFAILGFAYVAILGANEVWGFVEGIQILVKGDAGLAAQGYKVAAPAAYPNVQPTAPAQANPAPVASTPAPAVTTPAPATPAPAPAAPATSATETPAAQPAPAAPAATPEASATNSTTPTESN